MLVHKYMAQQSESKLFVKTGHERAQTRQTAGGHGMAIQFARTDPRSTPLQQVCGTVEQATRKSESFPEQRVLEEKNIMSDAVINQDILEDKSEKPVRTTSENIESELADHYHITRTHCPPGRLNTTLEQTNTGVHTNRLR